MNTDYTPSYAIKLCPGEVRMVRDRGEKKIRGYAAVFYDGQCGTEFELAPGLVERIMPGAFDNTMDSGADVVALFNHDHSLVLGRRSAGTLELGVDDIGLHYTILPPDTSTGRDVVEMIKRRDVTGSSFGFKIRDENYAEDPSGTLRVRELRDVQVIDVGPVLMPAYDSSIAEVRTALKAFLRLRQRRRAAVLRRMALDHMSNGVA